jgi:hypothetical protein
MEVGDKLSLSEYSNTPALCKANSQAKNNMPASCKHEFPQNALALLTGVTNKNGDRIIF